MADLVDEGRIRTTLTRTFEGLTSENLRAAHAQLESGHTIGKVVLTPLSAVWNHNAPEGAVLDALRNHNVSRISS
ncbi:zinc-binding dehydrogenase [Pseudonocardia terrae]|uniref:zinc-binding dehydrogenase n=1 Tax=Pseudonocardia terrae TaxID=2905831 RepID=UPI0035570A83